MNRSWVIPKELSLTILVLAAAIFSASPAVAADLSTGEFKLNLDTSISWGARYRVEDPDLAIIGVPNGGTAFSVNGDDGNLNFEQGLVSNALRATVDLDFGYKNFGAFVRGTGFYDNEIENGDTDRTPLPDEAADWVGSRAELLDAFVFYKFRVGNGGGQLRAGRQVLNWGESTFTQGGLNSINPVDVATLRVPGSELREAYRPSGMVWGSFGFTKNLSAEAFYQYQWEETIADPSGTYFSANDFAGLGGSTVFLAFGSFADTGDPPFFAQPGLTRPFIGVPHATDREPGDDGQYGVAVRFFADKFAGTEFAAKGQEELNKLTAKAPVAATKKPAPKK